MSKTSSELITRDWLAIERTKLANERTFLAYFRTFLVLLATGITILKLEILADLTFYGIILIVISAIVLALGIYRLRHVKKVIRKHYKV